MSDSDSLQEMIWEAQDLPKGLEKMAALEEAIRIADSIKDIEAGYHARIELIVSATDNGFKEKAMVAFAWCLSTFDKNPDQYDCFDILWYFKWILDGSTEFTSISRERIIGLQDEMEQRLNHFEFSLRPIHYLRMDTFNAMGDFEEAERWFKEWKKAKRDSIADCRACEKNSEVYFFAAQKKDAKALKLASLIIDGKMSCSSVPQTTYGGIVRPLLRLGKIEEATKRHEECFRMLSGKRDLIGPVSEHLLLLAHTKNKTKGIRLYEKTLAMVHDSLNDDDRFRFYAACWPFLEMLANNTKRSTRKLRLPSSLPCYREDAKYDPMELSHWFYNQANDLAQRFNQRNGNQYYSEILQESHELALAKD
ncbi:MAG: hypothetical protein COA78_33920 [Blastopirellula sp.]|nr:MAG: hypothetical protein COA78_33920 [Blastopirellula sp.]